MHQPSVPSLPSVLWDHPPAWEHLLLLTHPTDRRPFPLSPWQSEPGTWAWPHFSACRTCGAGDLSSASSTSRDCPGCFLPTPSPGAHFIAGHIWATLNMLPSVSPAQTPLWTPDPSSATLRTHLPASMPPTPCHFPPSCNFSHTVQSHPLLKSCPWDLTLWPPASQIPPGTQLPASQRPTSDPPPNPRGRATV